MVSKADEHWDEIGDNPLVITSEINMLLMEAKDKWAKDTTDFLDDEDVKAVLKKVLAIISGESIDYDKVPLLMVQLEAYNVKFRDRFSAYMGPQKGTTDANMKKNHYKELYTGIDRLVDALKYLVRG
jgi:hypothetical protein